jgi:copper chaperone
MTSADARCRPQHEPNVIWPLLATVIRATPYSGRRPGPTLAAGSTTIIIVSIRSFAVTGMSCEHCARAVRAEISRLPGITAVDVDVAAGTVRVTGDPLPGDAPLRAAIEDAGYEFAG